MAFRFNRYRNNKRSKVQDSIKRQIPKSYSLDKTKRQIPKSYIPSTTNISYTPALHGNKDVEVKPGTQGRIALQNLFPNGVNFNGLNLPDGITIDGTYLYYTIPENADSDYEFEVEFEV